MNKRQSKQSGMGLRRLILLVCAVMLVLAGVPIKAYADTEKEVVRVGYYENEIFQEGAEDGKVKKGYAYEYYRKLSEYTGWEYEYVYGDLVIFIKCFWMARSIFLQDSHGRKTALR